MQKVLIPTDFSENAYNAIKYALRLFKDVETTFYLLHTYTPAIYQAEYVIHSPGQIGLGDVLQEKSLAQLAELMEKLDIEFKNPKHMFIPHSAFNVLVDEVVETVEKENADLIIMGTQGATGAKEIFLGSNAVHVLKRATCPVIIIPSGFEFENPKEILFPTDYEIDYKKEQLKVLLDIAKEHMCSIEVIHVSEGYDLTPTQLKNKQKLDEILAKTVHLFHALPNQGVIAAINGFQMKKRMNFLVMVKNKHTFLERLFIEPVIKKIALHVTIPFMVIPHKEK